VRNLQTTIHLIGIISIGCMAISSGLPGLAQTVIKPTIQRPTIVRQVTHPSARHAAPTKTSRTSHSTSYCFQIDADSRMYVRAKNGSGRTYVADGSINSNRTMKRLSRCD
jgi:hypothetical protein